MYSPAPALSTNPYPLVSLGFFFMMGLINQTYFRGISPNIRYATSALLFLWPLLPPFLNKQKNDLSICHHHFWGTCRWHLLAFFLGTEHSEWARGPIYPDWQHVSGIVGQFVSPPQHTWQTMQGPFQIHGIRLHGTWHRLSVSKPFFLTIQRGGAPPLDTKEWLVLRCSHSPQDPPHAWPKALYCSRTSWRYFLNKTDSLKGDQRFDWRNRWNTYAIKQSLSAEDAWFLASIGWGNGYGLRQTSDWWIHYKCAGLLHFLVISGGHLSFWADLFGYVWCHIGRWFRRSRHQLRRRFFFIWGGVIFWYLYYMPFSIPLVRAASMQLLGRAKVFQAASRQVHVANFLVGTACGFLIWQPALLSNLSFQLSYGSVLAQLLHRFFLKKMGFYRKFPILSVYTAPLSNSLAVYLWLAPLMIHHFNGLAPYGVVLSWWLALWSYPLFVLGLLTLICPARGACAYLFHWTLCLFEWGLRQVSRCPYAWISFPGPVGCLEPALYYLFLISSYLLLWYGSVRLREKKA